MSSEKILNFNVGVLGHVDSGKTSFSKVISTIASTASFDKNPQSKERGITLDLGFSSFRLDPSSDVRAQGFSSVQYTLVDCPGHASLIKTVIGGAQIIDLMILVVDIVKGMQTQTAECLVIGDILCNHMIVLLNKVDLVPEDKRAAAVEKMTKKMKLTLEKTCLKGSPVVAFAAKPGGPEAPACDPLGLEEFLDTLRCQTYVPRRSADGPFLYAVDHCFALRGQGTVLTGTVLSGSVKVGDTVEIPTLKLSKKVKSMQMFRKPIDRVIQGDRVGICVTQFDPSLLERGLVCSAGAVVTLHATVISVNLIPYYKNSIQNKAKFHVTIGHETVMARVSFFGYYGEDDSVASADCLDLDVEYRHQSCLISKQTAPSAAFDSEESPSVQFALLEFERPVTCAPNSRVIVSKLDTDIHANLCRLAFHGRPVLTMTEEKYVVTFLPKIKIYKSKEREGIVERMTDAFNVIARGLFKKETNMQLFEGLRVQLSTGELGRIESTFGQSGKIKVYIPDGLSESTQTLLSGVSKKKSKAKAASKTEGVPAEDTHPVENVKLFLRFKRYVYDPQKKLVQSR